MAKKPQKSAGGRVVVEPDSDADVVNPETESEVQPDASLTPAATQPMSKFRESAATITAIAVILLLGIFYTYMLTHVDDDNAEEWARRTAILGGVEAVVFVAAGFLFGAQAQRPTVKAAENTAAAERQQAHRAQMRAEREGQRAQAAADGEAHALQRAKGGEMLAAAVLAKTEGDDRVNLYGEMGDSAGTQRLAAADLGELRALALAALE